MFHKGQSEVGRPEAVLIAAGAAHSSAVTRDGAVLAWRSMDPALHPQEVGGPLAGKSVTAISAGESSVACFGPLSWSVLVLELSIPPKYTTFRVERVMGVE